MKKKKIKLDKQQKDFVKTLCNYAISLCVLNETRSINELCEIIKYQNERRIKNNV